MKYEREKIKRKQQQKKSMREEQNSTPLSLSPQEEKNSFEFPSWISVSLTDKYSAVVLTASQRSYFKKNESHPSSEKANYFKTLLVAENDYSS